jgi:integrase
MSKRQPGTGTVETLSSGRFRARIWLSDGARHDFGPFDTEDEAQETLDAIAIEVSECGVSPSLGMTWAGWLENWQKSLQASKAYVGMANVRSIVRKRLKVTPFADWPLRRITEFVVRRWVGDLSKRTDIGVSSKRQTLLYARKAFQAAVDAGVLDKNPTVGIKVERGLAPTEEPWTFLTLEEQTRLLADESLPATMPKQWRWMVAFAFGTGLRAGEQWNLRLADLHLGEDPHVVVRYGSKKRAPKGRKIRRVPLFGVALDAARAWVAQLDEWCPSNPDGLVFPGPQGGRQKVSRLPKEWKAWLHAAGIDRRVRWHDLRHTCGSSLVSGWWGRTWTLQEVRDLLGHASIDETERYAHLGETALKKAARDTSGHSGSGALGSQSTSGPNHMQNAGGMGGWRTPPSLTPYSHETAEKTGQNTPSLDSAWTGAAELAKQLARAAAAGSPEVHALRIALGASVFASRLVTLAAEAMGSGPHAIDRAIELAAIVIDLGAIAAASSAEREVG